MFCEECGFKNKKDALFCEECGHSFVKNSIDVSRKNNIKRGRPAKVKEEPVAVEVKPKRGRPAKVKEEPVVVDVKPKRGRPAKVKEEPVKVKVEKRGISTKSKKEQVAVRIPPKKENVNAYSKPIVKNDFKAIKVSSRKKMTIILGLIIILILGVTGLSIYFYNITLPNVVANNYLYASSYNDVSELYNYFNVDGVFTSKSKFVEKYNNTRLEEPSFEYNILDYTVDGETSIVKIVVNDEVLELEFVKDGNIYFFFPNWKIKESSFVSNDYYITVAEDSIVSIDGVLLDSKYLDQDIDDESYDYYIVDLFSNVEYDLSVIYPEGFLFEDKFIPSDSIDGLDISEFDISLLSDDVIKDIEDSSLKYLNIIYQSIIEGNSFSDIKDNFVYTDVDYNNLEDSYIEYYDDVTKYYDLDEVSLNDAYLYYVDLNKDGTIMVTIESDLYYEVSYIHEDDFYNSVKRDIRQSIYLKYVDGKYEFAGIRSMTTYFPE